MIQSPVFWAVLVGSVPLFWLLPMRIRPGFLAAVSLGYLLTLAPWSVCALVAWTLAFFYLAPQIVDGKRWRRAILSGLILAILGYLAYFKYIPPLIAAVSSHPLEANLLIPLGISYYTFKLIHYAAEVARGNVQDRSLSRFFCYILLFPIFTAGPIERFDHFLANQDTGWQLDSMVEGLTRIVYGLIKRFLVAEVVLRYLFFDLTNESLLADLAETSAARVWAFLIVSFVFFYLDFSAYSDLAIGCSRLFGFRIMENFNFPILACNIGEFWRRWHMTLSSWCQTYVYMPLLGLYRKPLVALYGSFIVFGLWHAGTLARLSWGLYHATGVAVFMTWARFRRRRGWRFSERGIWPALSFVVTQAFVSVSMAFLVIRPEHGVWDSLRILCKLVLIEVPD